MKTKVLIIIAAIIFVGGIIGSVLVLNAPAKSAVIIRRDSEVLYTLDLSKEPDRVFTLEYGESSNTIEIKDGRIRVKEAECPDKTCVKTGWLSSSAIPIVCLPNHLVIEFVDSGEIDGMAG